MIEEISLEGPLTFARFMDLALYDQSHGYYMTSSMGQAESSRDRIGWEGDFYTAPELSPILAHTLVRQVVDIDAQLGHPSLFTMVEMGGGNGTFAADFLQQCQTLSPDLFNRLRYTLVERSPNLQSLQVSRIQQLLGSCPENRVTWVHSVEQLDSDSVVGVMFSNELVDAFPVHRVGCHNQCLQELLVDHVGGQFVERLAPLSSPKIEEYVSRHGIALQEGQRSELHVAAEEWMVQVARVLQQGVVITIDYGHTASDYYAPHRKDGTLLCYYKHAVKTNPYIRVGEQDMTAHVNFSALAKVGEASGLSTVGFTTLANWLMGLGVEELVQDQDPESAEIQALSQLLRPHGMGTTFKVFVQQKGIESVALKGLRYRAFFDEVL